MTTKKRTTIQPDVAVLKGMVQEQTLKIAELERGLAEAVKAKDEAAKTSANLIKERDEIKAVVENAHDLMDSCPAALPRTKTIKPYTWSVETRDEPMDLLVRMGSWLGATRG